MNAMNHHITKASGTREPFSEIKLRHSLQRSGASAALTDEIVIAVRDILYDGITTKAIYKKAFEMLRKQSRSQAGRYHMKSAIMELGPSGFPFEQYVAEILRKKGYAAQTNLIMQGRCVKHEMDIICTKNNLRALIECKYHNSRGIFCDVKVPLYIHSRFDDIRQCETRPPGEVNEGWLITNTRFSDDAIQYGSCAGLKLVGWNYPARDNLQSWIERSGLYPITCLTTLTRKEKKEILRQGTVLCSDLLLHKQVLKSIGMQQERIDRILQECGNLAKPVDPYQALH